MPIFTTFRGKVIHEINTCEDYLDFIQKYMIANIRSIDNIIDVLPDYTKDRTVTRSEFILEVNRCITSKYPKRAADSSLDYWLTRGYNAETARMNISKSQQRKSKRHPSYWKKEGTPRARRRRKFPSINPDYLGEEMHNTILNIG